MDAGEDEFDRILREDTIPDGFFDALDALERLPSSSAPPISVKAEADLDEFDTLLSDEVSSDFLLALDEMERLASQQCSTSSSPPPSLSPASSAPRPVSLTNPERSALPISAPLYFGSAPLLAPRSIPPPPSPLRVITNAPTTPPRPRNKSRLLCSPISISSDSSSESDDDDETDDTSPPFTSPLLTDIPPSVPQPRLSTIARLANERPPSFRPNLKRKAPAVEETPPSKKPRHHNNRPQPQQQPNPHQTHLHRFFSAYPRFTYVPNLPASAQYHALCHLYNFHHQRGRTKSPKEKADADAAFLDFQDALAQTFVAIYGGDVNRLPGLQYLCEVLHVDPIPQSIWACKAYLPILTYASHPTQKLRTLHVNIVDLVDCGLLHNKITPSQIFATEQALVKYTRDTRKIFAIGRAKGTLLKFLLRKIFNRWDEDEEDWDDY
ncbi:hypothetical protein R3P38DRAFT_3254070 [Favolaschia claudopus]|uniref:Uncharacterized protein n=1 Tax=Favolaschia claudopus TaxID=2862362 RepID=A0AAW0DNJ9_9AGAR